MELLSKGAMYPAQVSKELGIHEQSAYYYIRKLVSIGAVEEAGMNFVRGGTARLYKASSPLLGIEMDWGGN
jgi:Sugar-specific transcriptional regulator TrmB.